MNDELTDRRVMSCLRNRADGHMTTRELAQSMHIDCLAVSSAIRRLADQGLVSTFIDPANPGSGRTCRLKA